MVIDGLIDRLKLFLKEKTYTYILDIYDFHFNGYILKIEKTKVWFYDDKLENIPILLEEIKEVSYSNKK